MRTSTKRILSVFLSGIFLIGILVTTTSLIKPEFDKATKKRAQLFSKESLFENQRDAVNQVQQLIQEFQEFSQLQETVGLAMPTSENITQILNQLDAIARTSRAQIVSFTSAPGALEKSTKPLVRRLGSLELQMVVEGKYDSIKNFVELLETNVRLFEVKHTHLSSFQKAGEGLVHQVNLTIRTYFQE